MEEKTAIILASFGTTVPEAVKAIINIQDHIKAAFPGIPVRNTFTSNIIRGIWQERQAEAQKWIDQGIPEDILHVKNIIATFGDLLEEGYNNIIVQPTHMYYMEQAHDLRAYVHAMRSIRTIKKRWTPFNKIAMGRPVLGTGGVQYDYREDIVKAVATLKDDVALAKEKNATLIYMGHGNSHWSAGIYGETAKEIRKQFPGVQAYIGVVEGYPGTDDVLAYLSHFKDSNVILKPFMIVAGDHATNDMASDEDDSWKSIFEKEGFKVETVLSGLGENDAFAEIFVQHIRDAAKDMHIPLEKP